MEKWLITSLGQGKYKMSREHLVVPESCAKTDGAASKTHRTQLEGALTIQIWDGVSIQRKHDSKAL